MSPAVAAGPHFGAIMVFIDQRCALVLSPARSKHSVAGPV